MKPRITLTAGRKLKWLAPLLALVLLAGGALAAERFLIPQQLGLPFYARGLGHTDTGWVVTAFYRPLECVPKNVDLYLVDFNIDPACPLFVEGFAVLEEGAFMPMHEELQNVPGAPMPRGPVPGAPMPAPPTPSTTVSRPPTPAGPGSVNPALPRPDFPRRRGYYPPSAPSQQPGGN